MPTNRSTQQQEEVKRGDLYLKGDQREVSCDFYPNTYDLRWQGLAWRGSGGLGEAKKGRGGSWVWRRVGARKGGKVKSGG